MCVWSAYIGKKQAAAEVWKTGTAIEGIWGGFYTGIAAVDASGIHCAKCCGYSKYWEEKFSLSDLPGNAGFFHSRTNSGGDEAWGHPFVGTNKHAVLMGQGSDGVFSDMSIWAAEGNKLAGKGKQFPARAYNVPLKRYPVLADGAKVHVSEIMAQAVEAMYEETKDALATLRAIGTHLKEEAITLVMFHDQPEKIYFINMNQSGVIYFTPEGAYAASSRLAFGLPLVKYTAIPLNCIGYFTAESFYSENLPDPGYPLLDRIPDGVYTAAVKYLRGNPGSLLAQITDGGFGPLFPSEGIRLRAIAAHRLAETLCAEGVAERKDDFLPGPCGTQGLVTRFYYKG